MYSIGNKKNLQDKIGEQLIHVSLTLFWGFEPFLQRWAGAGHSHCCAFALGKKERPKWKCGSAKSLITHTNSGRAMSGNEKYREFTQSGSGSATLT